MHVYKAGPGIFHHTDRNRVLDNVVDDASAIDLLNISLCFHLESYLFFYLLSSSGGEPLVGFLIYYV